MALVDWTRIIPGTEVTFSTLAIPDERDEFDVDVAQFRLSDRTVLDVEWDNDERRYALTVFQGEYENQLEELRCDTPSEVIESVKAIVDRRMHSPIVFEPTSN